MIEVEKLYKKLNKKINFYTGVPDSVLKTFSTCLERQKKNHYIATNEGSAIALAIGNYLNTKKIGLVYMQNSGLGNAINPLISIAEKSVYSIPMVLLVGWRGAPGHKDEPQHIAKGKITLEILNNLKIKYLILNNNSDLKKIDQLINYAKKNNIPVCILIKPKTLSSKRVEKKILNNHKLTRETFLINLLKKISKNERLITTTGYTSREIFQIRKEHHLKNGKDFYMVGGMGHSSMVALGCSINSKEKINCIDGDGSLLMHMGGLASIGAYAKKNLRYILLNNNCHESVGGQKTISNYLNFKKISEGLNFKKYDIIKDYKDLKKLDKFFKLNGPSFLEVRIKNVSIKNLGRPKNLKEIKERFMSKIINE